MDSPKPRKGKRLPESSAVIDSYQNLPARLGLGSGNIAGAGNYPLTRLTHDYMLMLSLYRSHWIIRKVVDCFAEDMLKDFPVLSSEITPEEIKRFEKVVRVTATLPHMLKALKWGRLFGGGINLILIAGHDDLSKPLEIDDVEPGSYRGLRAFDRWSGVQPDAEVVNDINDPSFGLPRSYTITTEGGTINVHHTRVLRFTGRELPEWERQTEQYWGLSEVELLFDELQKRDYTSWNIVSMLTRAQIFSITEPELQQMVSGLGMSNQAYKRYVDRMQAMSDSMNNQGLMILGKDGQLNQHTYSFSGVADLYNAFMMDVAGASEYSVTKLFGRTVTGLGQTGEQDNQSYYDTVEQKRVREINPVMDYLIPIICMSTFGQVPDDLDYTWRPVRTMTDKDRAELADKVATSVATLYGADLLTKREARMEIKQMADQTGLGSNITDEAIAATPDKFASQVGGGELDEQKLGAEDEADPKKLDEAEQAER